MNGKALVQSKEFWFNVAMFVVDTAAYLETVIPQKYLPLVLAIHAVGNIFIRTFLTKQPITSFFPK